MSADLQGPVDLGFSGESVLVVGGSSGIGNGIAHAFRRQGAQVHVWGTRAAASDYTGQEGSDLAGLGYTGVDVTDRAAVEAAARQVERIDVLVLCQGTVIYGRGEFEAAGWDHVMAVNLDSLMTCAGAFKAKLATTGGRVIIVSSVSGYRATRGNPAYAASKAAAISLTRTLGAAWAADGVRVNGIAPGAVDTKLTKVTTGNPQRLEAMLATIPLGRLGEPAEIGRVALFLASHLSSYIVGQTITADGGLTLA